MSIFRVQKNGNYTVMSNAHFKERNMSLKAKGLLSLMLSLPEEWDYSIEGLTTLSSDGETAVRSALKELEQFGYLIRKRVYENGKILDWEYNIYELPQENLDVENQQVENQVVENQAQLNKKQLSKKELNKNNSKELLENSGETKKLIKKPNLYQKCTSMILDFTEDTEFRNLLFDYLSFRLEIKDKPIYANQWKGMLNKLDKLCGDDDNLGMQIVQQSLDRGYLSFFPINGKNKEPKNQNVGYYDDPEYVKKQEKWLEERRKNGQRTEF